MKQTLPQFAYILPHCTEVRFANFLSSGFITPIVVNPPERKLANCTSVRSAAHNFTVCIANFKLYAPQGSHSRQAHRAVVRQMQNHHGASVTLQVQFKVKISHGYKCLI